MPRLWTRAGFRAFARNLKAAFSQDLLLVFPPAVAFNMLACAIPFLLVLFSVFGELVADPAGYRVLSEFLVSQLPVLAARAGGDILSGARVGSLLGAMVAHRGAALLVGAGFLVVTASALMQTLRIALSAIFGVSERRHPLHARLHGLLLFGLIGECVLIVAALLWGLVVLRPVLYAYWGGRSPALALLFRVLYRGVILGGDFLLIYGLYRLLPDRRPSPRAAGAAAILFLILWQAARIPVGFYFRNNFQRYSLLYGAYSAVVVGALWLYYSSFMFIWCAAAGKAYAETVSDRRAADFVE